MDTLPIEITQLLLEFIHPLYVTTARKVCKSWREMIPPSLVDLNSDEGFYEWKLLGSNNIPNLSKLWKFSIKDTETLVNEIYELYIFSESLFSGGYSKSVNDNRLGYCAMIIGTIHNKPEITQEYIYLLDHREMGAFALTIGSLNIVKHYFVNSYAFEGPHLEVLTFCNDDAKVYEIADYLGNFGFAAPVDLIAKNIEATKKKMLIHHPITIEPKDDKNYIDKLPVEILSMILIQLDHADTIFAQWVSHKWYMFTKNNIKSIIYDRLLITLLEYKNAHILSKLCSIAYKKAKLLIRETHKSYKLSNISMWSDLSCCSIDDDKICFDDPWFVQGAIAVAIKLNIPMIYKKLLPISSVIDIHVNMAVVSGNIEAFKYFSDSVNINKRDLFRMGYLFACSDKVAAELILVLWNRLLNN